MKTHLLNALAQTSKENRLLFDKPPEAQPPAKAEGAKVDKKEPAKAEGAKTDKPEKPTEADLKKNIQEKVASLKTIVGPVSENKDSKYTKGLAETAKKTIAAITEIEEILKDEKALEKKANKEKAKKALLKLDEDLKFFSKENLEANERAQTNLIDVRKQLEEKKKAVTEDEVLKKLGIKPEELEAKRKEYKINEQLSKIFKEIEDLLNHPHENGIDKLNKDIATAQARVNMLTIDFVVDTFNLVEKIKKTNEKAYEIMRKGNDGKDLDFTIEEFKSAMGTYKLGEHENPTEKAKAKSIMNALKKNQEALKKEGIILGFFGGTDGNDFKKELDSNPEFNKNKKEAFKGILAFKNAGKLPLTPEHEELINKYIAATDIKAFFSDEDIKSKFFDGHGLFDLALAYQRAQDRKRLFTGKKDAVLDPKEDIIATMLGDSKAQDNEERKSGMFVFEAEAKKEEFKGKYTTPEFRDEIRKDAPNATDKEIEAKTIEVLNEKKHGDNVTEARKNPAFKNEVIKRLTAAPAEKPYTMEFKDNKLTVKFKDEEKPREYVVGKLPDGVKAEVEDGKYLVITSGEDKAFVEFTDKKEAKQDFVKDSMSLRRSHAITIDVKATPPTITVEKRKEVADHGYIYNEETKELTVKNKDTGKVDKYKINAPADVEISAVEGDDGDFFLNVTSGDKGAWIEFDANGKFSSDSSDDVKAKGLDLAKTYDITPDGNTINIKPKAVPVTPAEKPAEKPADYDYKLNEDGTKLSFIATNGAFEYTIQKPKEAKLSVKKDGQDPNDKFILVELNGAAAIFEFDSKTGKFIPGGMKGSKDLNDEYKIECDNVTRIISITPKEKPTVPPPAEPPTPITPPAAHNAAEEQARAEKAAAAEELKTTLGTAKEEVSKKMDAADAAIKADTSMLALTGVPKSRMEEAKADFQATFVKVKGLLGEAEKLAKEGKIPEAKAKYAEAQTILADKLKKAKEKDSAESGLDKKTQESLEALRAEVAVQEPKVKDAFDKIIK